MFQKSAVWLPDIYFATAKSCAVLPLTAVHASHGGWVTLPFAAARAENQVPSSLLWHKGEGCCAELSSAGTTQQRLAPLF